MPRQSSRASQNQPSTSQANKSGKRGRSSKNQEDTLTQTKIDEHCVFPDAKVDDLVNNCVRYFVYNAGHNKYFTKAELNKHVMGKAGMQFQQIIEKTAEILKDAYGYNLLVCDQTANTSKAYILSNALSHMDYSANPAEPDTGDPKKIALLLILCHIYMSNSSVTEASLYSFLSTLKIETNKRHPLFGHIKDYIMNTLIKQKYLAMETDPVSKKVSFSWGVRAEKEISKHEILKFVCKIYKDRKPESWADQFRAANEQGFENEKITENSMDVDAD